MAYLKTLERSQRIRMFLDGHYFGNSRFINLVRLTGGPLVLALGAMLWFTPSSRAGIAYAGICFFYGLYYTLKPYLWIFFRRESFKTIHVNIELKEDSLRLVEDASEAEIKFGSMRRIIKRKTYYMLEIAKYTRMYVPFTLLTEGQCGKMDENLRNTTYPVSGKIGR